MTPMRRTGTGSFSLTTEQTASPRPPMMLCSSTVMMRPHSRAAVRMIYSSMGLMVGMLMTRTFMPWRLASTAARRASLVIRPVEMTAMS